MSQGHEKYFGRITLPNIIVCVTNCYFLMVILDLQAYGWIAAKLIYEIVQLTTGLWVYLNKTTPETRGLVSFREATEGLVEFMKDTVKMMLGNYLEWIGYELAGYFVAISQKQSEITGYVSCYNFAGYTYCMSISISIVARTRINVLRGIGKMRAAKNYFIFMCLTALLIGLCFIILYSSFQNQISNLYANSTPEVRQAFLGAMRTYIMFIPFEVSLLMLILGLKTLKKLGLIIAVTSINSIGLNLILLNVLRWYDMITAATGIFCLYFGNTLNSIIFC